MNKITNKFFRFSHWIKSGCHFGIGWREKEEKGFCFAKCINLKFCWRGIGWQKYDHFFILDVGILRISYGKEMFFRKLKSKRRVFIKFY